MAYDLNAFFVCLDIRQYSSKIGLWALYEAAERRQPASQPLFSLSMNLSHFSKVPASRRTPTA